MFKKLWGRIRNVMSFIPESEVYMSKEMMIAEYRSVLYAIHHAQNLQQLLHVRQRIRDFHQQLIENSLEIWGRKQVVELNRLWNAKFKYWKNKTRNH